MKRLCSALAVAAAFGCASDPVVDRKGLDRAQYERDLAECREYAKEVNTAATAAKDGAIGAAVGGALGAILGDSDSAAKGAGAGAVIGSTRGFEGSERRKEQIVENCLSGRGYSVLG